MMSNEGLADKMAERPCNIEKTISTALDLAIVVNSWFWLERKWKEKVRTLLSVFQLLEVSSTRCCTHIQPSVGTYFKHAYSSVLVRP